jgi:hypothetical protein
MMETKSGATAREGGPIADAPKQPKPIFLRAADVRAKARDAFLRGKLEAQKDPTGAGGSYAGPCAIGIALTPSQRHRLDALDLPAIRVLIEDGIVKTDNSRTLIALQTHHDERSFKKLRRMLGIPASVKVAVPAAAKPRST